MEVGTESVSEEVVVFIASKLQELSFEMAQHLHLKLNELNIPISSLTMNYLLYNSAHYYKYDHMTQLVTEATVLDLSIDLNTYVKLLSSLYTDITVKFDRTQYIQMLMTLFGNEHSTEAFTLGSELLREFLWSNSF